MRILWLNAGLLVPLDKGGKLRTWHLLRHLARRHEVTYLCFAEPGVSPELYGQMWQVCTHLETVPRVEAPRGSARFYLEALRGLFDPRPFAVARYRSRAYTARLAALLASRQFDLLVCDFLVPAVNLPSARLPCRSVLFTHNVEAEIWRRHTETARGHWWRWLMRTQWARMRRFEAGAMAGVDSILAVSETDRRTIMRAYPAAAGRGVGVIPTGVDTSYFAPTTPDRTVPGRLVFTGSMDWMPNEDGILYFCRQVLPCIKADVPEVSVSIVGRAPSAAVRRLASEPGIQVTGAVEDVRPHMAQASACIVPLRVGGGTRLKIFEAMAMAKAVVSTTVGAEGLPVTHGRDILIADHPEAFAGAVVRLLRDQRERLRIAQAARDLVAARYDWSVVARDLERALVEAATGDRHRHRVTGEYGPRDTEDAETTETTENAQMRVLL